MAALSEGDGNARSFPTVAAAAAAVNIVVAEKHGFRVRAGPGRYVKCVRAGEPEKKAATVGKKQRNRKSHKCDCGFSLSVSICFDLIFVFDLIFANSPTALIEVRMCSRLLIHSIVLCLEKPVQERGRRRHVYFG